MFDYNYSKYWKKSGKTYKSRFNHNEIFVNQETQFIKYLKGLDKFDSVFELGCGFGRITNLVKQNFDITTYDAIDISQHQIDNCDVKGVNFKVADFATFEPDRLDYDLVIASEVLMHIPPNMIEDVIGRLLTMTAKYAVTIDAFGDYQGLAKHNFIHPYPQLFSKYGKCTPVNIGGKQYLFGVEV